MCITKCSNMENVLIMVIIGCTIALICYIMCCMECCMEYCSDLDIKSADIILADTISADADTISADADTISADTCSTEKKAPRSEPVIQKNLSLMHPDQLNPIL